MRDAHRQPPFDLAVDDLFRDDLARVEERDRVGEGDLVRAAIDFNADECAPMRRPTEGGSRRGEHGGGRNAAIGDDRSDGARRVLGRTPERQRQCRQGRPSTVKSALTIRCRNRYAP